MNNKEIRNACFVAGLKLWELAERLGFSESGFSRKLRHELPEDEKTEILKVIRMIAEEGAK